MNNKNRRYSSTEKQFINQIGGLISNKQQMYQLAPALASIMGRTECAICKQIEIVNNWYWAAM